MRSPMIMRIEKSDRSGAVEFLSDSLSFIILIGGLILLLSAGCCPAKYEYDDPCVATVHGACVSVETGLSIENVEERVTIAVERSAEFWGASPDVVSGWRIHLTRDLKPFGVCDFCSNTIVLQVNDETMKCPTWSLPHEFGHVVRGEEAGHDDPRFLQIRTEYATRLRLAGCFGY